MAEAERERGVVVLTGATGVIGSEVAKGVVSAGMDLIMINRSEEKTKELIDELEPSDGAEVQSIIADLSSMASVQSAIKEILSKYEMIDVIINNATVVNSDFNQTDDGLELTFQVNCLSSVQLTEGLMPAVQKCAESGLCSLSFPRIIHVSSNYSSAALPEELSDFSKGNEEDYRGNIVYQRTKRANRMIATHYAAKFQAEELEIGSFSNDHGIVGSELLTSLGFPEGDDTPEQCAQSILHCALSSDISLDQNGMYFWRDSLKDTIECSKCRRSSDPELNAALYEHCLSILTEWASIEEEEAEDGAAEEEEAAPEEEEEEEEEPAEEDGENGDGSEEEDVE